MPPLHRSASLDGYSLSEPTTGADYLSPLSDELLIRILGYLSMPSLLSLAPVSRRFHRLADDSQLWKAIYYKRFVLPRAMRIPGFRAGTLTQSSQPTRHAVTETPARPTRTAHTTQDIRSSSLPPTGQPSGSVNTALKSAASLDEGRILDWKRQYRLRHNWARGTCAVEELRLGSGGSYAQSQYGQDDGSEDSSHDQAPRILVKVVDGIAVTADYRRGLRVWELKSRSMVAGERLARRKARTSKEGDGETEAIAGGVEAGEDDQHGDGAPAIPTSLAVDVTADGLDIAIGLQDGGFGLWKLGLPNNSLTQCFAHPASSSGPLTGIAYSHPYVLTATDSVLISLYAFDSARKRPARRGAGPHKHASSAALLSAPHLLTSLRSHTSRPPLALSIRKLAAVTIASIAYTFSTRQGWSIGIQDLHVKDPEAGGGSTGLPVVETTRLAYTLPVSSSRLANSLPDQRQTHAGTFSSPIRPRNHSTLSSPSSSSSSARLPIASSPPSMAAAHNSRKQRLQLHDEGNDEDLEGGPTTLCYTHPYLLATMPDNTLILHLCTSTASTLAISSGIRLWGHTSGISDAEITARGKAVSVSRRGEEMRVWELEGRPTAERGRSVAIRASTSDDSAVYDWDERRNWVGFDDEMVIVLKEARGGRESLLVYDFT